jgi:hypothetical protein
VYTQFSSTQLPTYSRKQTQDPAPRSRTDHKTSKRLTKHASALTLCTSCITTPLPAGTAIFWCQTQRTLVQPHRYFKHSPSSIFKAVNSEYLAHRRAQLNTCQETRVKVSCGRAVNAPATVGCTVLHAGAVIPNCVLQVQSNTAPLLECSCTWPP